MQALAEKPVTSQPEPWRTSVIPVEPRVSAAAESHHSPGRDLFYMAVAWMITIVVVLSLYMGISSLLF